MSRLHWFGLRIWFCTLQLAEKASCTDPAVIPGCIEQVYLYKPSVPIRPIEAICTKPGWYSRLYLLVRSHLTADLKIVCNFRCTHLSMVKLYIFGKL